MTSAKPWLLFATYVAAATSLAAIAQDRPVRVADSIEVTATVEKIDLSERLVTVSGPWKDRLVTMKVGTDIPDLDKLKVGDRVAVQHQAAMVAELKRSGTAERAQRAGPTPESGNRTAVVVIESVNADENSVTFTRDGAERTAFVEDPVAQEFIKTLKKGDEVELNYSEAFATTLTRVE